MYSQFFRYLLLDFLKFKLNSAARLFRGQGELDSPEYILVFSMKEKSSQTNVKSKIKSFKVSKKSPLSHVGQLVERIFPKVLIPSVLPALRK